MNAIAEPDRIDIDFLQAFVEAWLYYADAAAGATEYPPGSALDDTPAVDAAGSYIKG